MEGQGKSSQGRRISPNLINKSSYRPRDFDGSGKRAVGVRARLRFQEHRVRGCGRARAGLHTRRGRWFRRAAVDNRTGASTVVILLAPQPLPRPVICIDQTAPPSRAQLGTETTRCRCTHVCWHRSPATTAPVLIDTDCSRTPWLQHPSKGRRVVAVRSIAAGGTILIEQALVSVTILNFD